MKKSSYFLTVYAVGTVLAALSGNLKGILSLIGIAIGAGMSTLIHNPNNEDE